MSFKNRPDGIVNPTKMLLNVAPILWGVHGAVLPVSFAPEKTTPEISGVKICYNYYSMAKYKQKLTFS